MAFSLIFPMSQTCCYFSSCLFTVALLLPLRSGAEDLPITPPVVKDSFISPYIDAPRDYVADKFVSFASGVDRFFGNDRNYQESNRSVLQFDVARVFEPGMNNKFVPTYRAKFHLPNTQKRLRLMIESNPDQNLPGAGGQTQGKASLFREVATPDSYGAALRIENREDSHWRFSADGGLKLEGFSLQPFVRSRVGYLQTLGKVQLNLTESVFWFNTIGLGESSQLDADHAFSDRVLFRASSGATWLYDKQSFALRQDFSLYQTMDERTSMLYQLSASGVNRPQAEVSEYVALMLYRHRLHKDWVFLEMSPQLHYPKIDNYRVTEQFIVRLEMLFSK